MKYRVEQGKPITRPNPGSVLLEAGLAEEAYPHLKKWMDADPGNIAVYCELGACLKHLGRLDEAVDVLTRGLELVPNHGPTRFNLGLTLEDLGRFEEALVHIEIAHNEIPQYWFVPYEYLRMLQRTGRLECALKIWELAQRIDPGLDFKTIKRWTGESLDGKRVLVHREGGFGDGFWMLRYLKVLKDRGAIITFQGWQEMTELLRGHPWIDKLTDSRDEVDDQDYDFWVPLQSLPGVTVIVPLPMTEPYIAAPDGEPVRCACERPVVGVFWKAGEYATKGRKFRFIQAEHLAKLRNMASEIHWVSLQMDEPCPDWCEDVTHRIKRGWHETATIIQSLDLVIAMESSVAMLAGAMGKECWVIASLNTPWFIKLDAEDNDWFPSWRTFRNTAPISYEPVVDRVVEALKVRFGLSR